MQALSNALISSLLVVLVCQFISCSPESSDSKNEIKPSSTGALDELVIVIDDNLYKSYVGDSLFQHLNLSYGILPSPEPAITLSVVSASEFNAVLQRFRSVLFVADLNRQSATSNYVADLLSSEQVEAAKDGKSDLIMVKNVWSSPQTVACLYAGSPEGLVEIITDKSKSILTAFSRRDLLGHKKIAFASGRNQVIEKKIAERLKLSIEIPAQFRMVVESDSLIWLRADDQKIVSNLIFTSKAKDENKAEDGIVWRNRFGKLVGSQVEGAYMSTDSILGFERSRVLVGGHNAIRTQGLWKMKGDFKGGPFIQYLINDPQREDQLLIEGFVFAPGEKKKPHMRRLEAILSAAQP